ncbi:helix-turn-helix domain-containing protein [Kocuria sp. CPCC 205316]|uniref:helix-turn-helix domain-containing protein n=1 Tax=Kocuria TaxID=57493 RepID=UPI0036D8239D
MSIQCMLQVWWHSESTGNSRLVLLAIADEADDDGRNAYPSMRRLAEKVNCNKDTVSECIKRLEAMGELEVKRPAKNGPGQFNRYRVLLAGDLKAVRKTHTGLVKGSVKGSVPVDPDSFTPKPVQFDRSIRTASASGARFPQPRKGCNECAGGWKEDEHGNALACGCETELRHG